MQIFVKVLFSFVHGITLVYTVNILCICDNNHANVLKEAKLRSVCRKRAVVLLSSSYIKGREQHLA